MQALVSVTSHVSPSSDETAALLAFDAVSGSHHQALQLALLGQRAENEFVGVACGILDQYTSVLGTAGHALLLDCRALTSRRIALPPDLAVVICDTRAPRQLTDGVYDERRAQCEAGARYLSRYDPRISALRDVSRELLDAHAAELPVDVARRSRFIVEENQRVLELAAVLPAGDREALATLFDASFDGAMHLFEIGASSMAAMHAAMTGAPGLIARRQAGAGFGGCLVAIVERDCVDRFGVQVAAAYAEATGIAPSVFGVEAAPGAGPVLIG